MLQWLRRSFVTGLVITVPLAVSVVALVWLFGLVESLTRGLDERLFDRSIPGLGLVVMGANIFNMGVVGTLGGFALYRVLCRLFGGEDRGRIPASAIAGWASVFVASIFMSVELVVSGTSPAEVVFQELVVEVVAMEAKPVASRGRLDRRRAEHLPQPRDAALHDLGP